MGARRLVAVVGATATGKSEAAVAVAEAFGGEIVGADAYQVYTGLDIGTARPDAAVRHAVPHHLLGVVAPDQPLTLARYLDLAQGALDDIWSRGRLPVVCGGSGQYVWALVEGWHVPRVPPDEARRRELEAFAAENGAAALHGRLASLDPAGAARLDPRNVRRVVRALELVTRTGLPLAACQARTPIDARVLILGLRCSRAELHRRIDERVDAMFAAGIVDEVRALRARGWGGTRPVRSAIGYREVGAYLDGEASLDQAISATKAATHRLARNQSAWFRESDARIHWLDAGPAAAGACVSKVAEWMAV